MNIGSVKDLKELREQWTANLGKQKMRILVCAGTGCVANGSLKIYEAIKNQLESHNVFIPVELLYEDEATDRILPPVPVGMVKSGCHGFCEMGPLVRLEPSGVLYTKVQPEDVAGLVEVLISGREPLQHKLYSHPVTGETYALEREIPFYKYQTRNALGNCGKIDPEDIREAITHGAYQGLGQALTGLTPEEVCGEMAKSGLRGRGGGGFATGFKWEATRVADNPEKYVVCNGDEVDPGAFMDRSVMEGDPHKVIEGMAIAGYAVGADQGYIYVRAEYPLAVQRLRTAIQEARKFGLLGKNILGSGFCFDIKIKEGAGAFVCGEETALLASIQGERGMPRPKPPFPAQSGLWGKPTLINNVETFANVPAIIINGSGWFKRQGTEKSPGTKTFALTGQVANTGLIEVPMGITLREIVFEIGGGIRNGKKFKAVQIGGPSGGCLTREHLDMKLDFDSLVSAGAMIGSGGLVVMDEDTCVVEVARFFMNFTQNESCGKCVPCREGTKRMLEILQRAVDGEGRPGDPDDLEELALAVKDGSLCGLGKTAPNPILSMFKYFKDEYMAHIIEKKCPAGVCNALATYTIDAALCKGCGKCGRTCPVQAITGVVKKPYVIDPAKCIKCGACIAICPFKAIREGK